MVLQAGFYYLGEHSMASQRGKQPSKNTPSSSTSKDMRLKGRGKKPGPKPKG